MRGDSEKTGGFALVATCRFKRSQNQLLANASKEPIYREAGRRLWQSIKYVDLCDRFPNQEIVGIQDPGWEGALAEFITAGRSSKCDRMAMAIGAEADTDMLSRFIAGTGHELFQAEQAEKIQEFFKKVTMSVVSRTLSQDPNVVPKDSDIRLDGPSRKTGPKVPAPEEPAEEEEGYW